MNTKVNPITFSTILMIVVAPLLLPLNLLTLVSAALIFGIFVMSLDIILGFAGLFNFAQIIVFGFGAYTVALLKIWFKIPTWIGLMLSPLVGLVVGLAIGLIASPFTKHYFAVMTLFMGEVIHRVFMYWSGDIGAESGVFIFGTDVHPWAIYYLTLLACLGSYWICRFLMKNSVLGSILKAIRENEIRIKFSGCNIEQYKTLSMGFSGSIAGFAGGLWSALFGVIDIHMFHWIYSAEALALNLVGGLGTLYGPLVIGSFLTFLKFVLNTYLGAGYLILLGLLVIISVAVQRMHSRFFEYTNRWLRSVIRSA